MYPLSSLTASEANHLRGLFFDLDDTFLEDGKLVPEALASLAQLRETGLLVVALTGRPASWAEMVARMWPVDAAIGENGPLAFELDGGRLKRLDGACAAERALRRQRLERAVAEAKQEVPLLVDADDVEGRVTDFTFDIGEHHQADEVDVQKAMAVARRHGARTTRSSVHLHFTFDRQDKATGALEYLRYRGFDTTAALRSFAFVGDSQNDAPCFSAFRTTVGVANVSGHFSIPPRYVTPSPRAAGFVELARHLSCLRA